MEKTYHGQCLCGEVTIKATQLDHKMGACHCSKCRKWGAGPFLGVDCGSAVTFTHPELISTFDSSDWAERGFCKNCGTHLFYRLKGNNQHIVPIDLFDFDSSDLKEAIVFDHQIFVDEKPGYYSFSETTHNMTGAEVFAQFAPTVE